MARKFFVSFQPDPSLMDFGDPEAFGHVEASSMDSAAEVFETLEGLDGDSNLHELALELAFGHADEDVVTLYVIEHDGESVLDGPVEYRCEFELEVRTRRPERVAVDGVQP